MNWLKRLFTLPKGSNSLEDIMDKFVKSNQPLQAMYELIKRVPFSVRYALYFEIKNAYDRNKEIFDAKIRNLLRIDE